jgi:hypothetical protein
MVAQRVCAIDFIEENGGGSWKCGCEKRHQEKD